MSDDKERKGAFYTPQEWVELSQMYLADVFGEDWQDEYYIWDCAAGTGNLLVGLTNKYNIYASTIDKADVDVMHDRIQNGANLLAAHCFQFDFLNDDFSKLPQSLQDIINDPKRRKKLIIYINPPYAETMSYWHKDKKGLHISKINDKYSDEMKGCLNRELFAQFLIRIYFEIPDCKIGTFSTLKTISSPNFKSFREHFQAKFLKGFICPSWTFDNVNGDFPIAFQCWDTEIQKPIKNCNFDIYWARIENPKNTGGIKHIKEIKKTGNKKVYNYDKYLSINDWLISTRTANENLINIAFIACLGNDFQTNKLVFIMNKKEIMQSPRGSYITKANLIPASIYFSVRKVIKATWLNDRDQFIYPNEKWKNDIEFHNDCLAYTLFNNNISIKHGVNHWIPFLENEVNAKEKFESHFMKSFISGKIIPNAYVDLFDNESGKSCVKREFSPEATAVFDAGKELWKYYHAQPKINVNASLYDIREHFQGRNEKTDRMNSKSKDEKYTLLLANLRSALDILAQKIEPKVYEYGFLLE